MTEFPGVWLTFIQEPLGTETVRIGKVFGIMVNPPEIAVYVDSRGGRVSLVHVVPDRSMGRHPQNRDTPPSDGFCDNSLTIGQVLNVFLVWGTDHDRPPYPARHLHSSKLLETGRDRESWCARC
jgi:hypothetical protein